MVHAIQRRIIPPLLRLFWVKEIKGTENIPKHGRFIVSPNHNSFFDDWIVPSIIIPAINKELHMYVNRKFFKNPLFRWYLNNHKSIPVEVYNSEDKKEVNEKAFQTALAYLKNNEPICIYPEGHRSMDGELQKARYGAARLALNAEVPVIPVGITGSRDILPKGKAFPRFKRIAKVRIGKPLFFGKYYKEKDKKESVEGATRIIMGEIGKLIGKEYRH